MINISGPSRLVLSPDTLATVLDALAEYGPFKRVNPAFNEILNQLKEANERTPASGSDPSSVSDQHGSGSPGPSPAPGLGSNGAGPEVEYPN